MCHSERELLVYRRYVLFLLLLGVVPSASARGAPLWTQTGIVRDGVNGVANFSGGYDAVISNDGSYLYAAAYNSSSLSVFSRNPTTGALTQVQVLVDNVGGVAGIGATRAVRLSPDGQFVYAAGTSDNALAIFSRNPATGQLTFQSQYTNGGPLNGLVGVNAMNISGDGKFVYASSETGNSLSTFARDSTTGALTFVETLKNGVNSMDSLAHIRSFTISSDDRFLYAPARDNNKVTQFDRNSVTGTLAVDQITPGGANFDGPTHITFSPDGKHAYVASQFSDSVSLFSVDSTSGNLTFVTTYHDNTGGFDYLNHAEDIAITADGKYVMITATIDNALTICTRDPLTGALTVLQEFRDGLAGIDGLFRPREMTLSPDNRFLYVMSPEENAIAIFTIPEPSTFWLACLGITLLLGTRLRASRTQH